MKKRDARPKPRERDTVIVSRIKNYLAENVEKPFVDVNQMARLLKDRYREYSNRPDSAFIQTVEGVYKSLLHKYGMDGASTSDGSEEESDLEMLEGGGGVLNDRLLAMYEMREKSQKRPASTREKTHEPIDILSSDEETAPKLPRINDQITVTPHVPVRHEKLPTEITITPSLKVNSEKKRKDNKPTTTKRKFDIGYGKSSKVNFEDIGGISDTLNQICDLILHMKHPEIYKTLGIKSPRGALLHGPPGTGKTLLAHAIAGKLDLPLIAVSGTELVGGMSGESEERIRELFERVSAIAPSVLFIDEIDAICGNRINAQKDMEKRMVAQLLASLDALGENDTPVLVLAATNNPDALDPALRRAGRLEQEITLGIPSLKARKEILAILCKNLALDKDIDLQILAQVTPGFVGADLQALVNKACTFAVKRVFNDIRLAELSKTKKELKDDVKITEPDIIVTNGVSESEEKVTKEGGDVVEEPPVEQESTEEKPVDKVEEPSDEVQVPIVEELPSKVEEAAPTKEIDINAEVLSILENTKPYTNEQLANLAIRQEDFMKALKTTKPCAVREGIITVPDVTWDDVGSLNLVRKDLQLAVLAPVKYPEQLKKLGLAVPSGVLLCGPPGCGKTLLAKAVANEAGVNFISVKGPELLNMYVGESERAVRTCFRRARNSAPCVIFFDEFDALCPRRSQQDHNGAARVVNQLLTEMDGIESREGVFVLAASNRPDIIDPAVLRPGRLDRVMYVGMPARDDRVDILQKITKNGTQPPLSPDVDMSVISGLTEGYTGADLAGLVRAAASVALTHHIASGTVDGEILVSFKDFREALTKCKPSVSAKEQLHYEKLRLKYASGIDEKDMEMETEAVNEESMDTV